MNSLFISNKAMQSSGVLSAIPSNITFSNCTFYENNAQLASVFGLSNSSLESYNSQYSNHFSNMITIRKNSAIKMGNCSIRNYVKTGPGEGILTPNDGNSIFLITGQYKSKLEVIDTEFHSIQAYTLIDLESGSSLLARYSLFQNNTVGSAISLRYSSQAVIDFCKILNNKASGSGSVISSSGGEIRISNTIIRGNSAAGSGGVIYGESPNVVLYNTTFMQNQASLRGGTICFIGNLIKEINLKAVYVQFLDNQGGSDGAAIFIQKPVDVVLDSCIFSNNKGLSDSAISFSDVKTLRISQCYFNDSSKQDVFPPSIYFTRSIDGLDTSFMTYESVFSRSNKTLSSSGKNFMTKAEKLGFVSVFDSATVPNYTIYHHESKYSSGKG